MDSLYFIDNSRQFNQDGIYNSNCFPIKNKRKPGRSTVEAENRMKSNKAAKLLPVPFKNMQLS